MSVQRDILTQVETPFAPRMRTRLDRAIGQALMSSARSAPTLRRAVTAGAQQLRQSGYSTDAITTLFAALVEDAARARALDARSLVSGQPRWLDVRSRVLTWAADGALAATDD
jgi:hypothetical protein